MICTYCNKTIVDDAIFCSYCGKRVTSHLAADYQKYYRIIKQYFDELKPYGIKVERYFNPPKKATLADIFYQFALNLQDYNMMPSVIGFLNPDRVPVFNEILLSYDSKAVLQNYTAETLYERFCEVFPVKNRDSKQNSWLKYSKGIIDTCALLDSFQSADDFYKYVEKYNGDISVVTWLSTSIHGMGFALACNVIKDLGFTDYAKPDTHTKDIMAATGLTDTNDINVINAIRDVAIENGDTAFNLDRMIWLICSGYYFLDDLRIKPHKKDLIERINKA